jgi:hypothetical protein
MDGHNGVDGMLRPMSSRRACNPVFGKVGGRLYIFLEMLSRIESASCIA